MSTPTNNSLQVIHAYLLHPRAEGGLWVFDEPRFNLVAEPFVPEASAAIDRALARKFPGTVPVKCRILFSTAHLPAGAEDLYAERIGGGLAADEIGCSYGDRTSPPAAFDKFERPIIHSFWLCPAMCHYLGNRAPERLYATIDSVA